MKLNRRWAAVGFLAVAQLMGKCKKNTFEIARIYGATAYLKGVSIARDLFLCQIGILAGVMFLVIGTVLVEGSVIFILPAASSLRGVLILIFGIVDLLIGFICLGYLASSKRWLLQASKYNAWLKASLEEKEFLEK